MKNITSKINATNDFGEFIDYIQSYYATDYINIWTDTRGQKNEEYGAIYATSIFNDTVNKKYIKNFSKAFVSLYPYKIVFDTSGRELIRDAMLVDKNINNLNDLLNEGYSFGVATKIIETTKEIKNYIREQKIKRII